MLFVLGWVLVGGLWVATDIAVRAIVLRLRNPDWSWVQCSRRALGSFDDQVRSDIGVYHGW